MARATDNPEPATPYRRLPGRGRRLLGRAVRLGATRSTLWLGADHLLVRDNAWIWERYKRFYFHDIQAIVIRRTRSWHVATVLGSILAVLFLALAVVARGYYHFPLAVALFFLVVAAVNFLRGPTCVTHLRTAVQTEELPSLCRVRKTRDALEILLPLITGRQGTLDLDSLGNEPAAAAPPQPGLLPVTGSRSTVHILAFAMLVASGGLALAEFRWPSALLYGPYITVALLALVAGVFALVRQGRDPVPRPAAVLTWITMIAYLTCATVIYMIYSTIYSIQAASAGRTSAAVLTPGGMREMAGFDYILVAYGTCSILLGLLGIWGMAGATAAAPPAAPPPVPNRDTSAPAA